MSDLIRAVRAQSDIIRATVVTHNFQFEGDMHCPKLGKEGRRLSNLLNSDRNFIALTNVQMTDRTSGKRHSKAYPLIQVSLNAIEFIHPYLEGDEAEHESFESDQSSTS